MSAHTRVVRLSCTSPGSGGMVEAGPWTRRGCCAVRAVAGPGHPARTGRPHTLRCRAATRPGQTEPAPALPCPRSSQQKGPATQTQTASCAESIQGRTISGQRKTSTSAEPSARSLADRLVAEAQAQAYRRAAERMAAMEALRGRSAAPSEQMQNTTPVSSSPTAAPAPTPPAPPAPPLQPPVTARAAVAPAELRLVTMARELGVREDEQRKRMLAAIAAAGQLTHARDVSVAPAAAVAAHPPPPAAMAVNVVAPIGSPEPPSMMVVVSPAAAAHVGAAQRWIDAWRAARAVELSRLAMAETQQSNSHEDAANGDKAAAAMTFVELAAAEYNAVVRKHAAQVEQTAPAAATQSTAAPVAAVSSTPEQAAPAPVQVQQSPATAPREAKKPVKGEQKGVGSTAWRTAARQQPSFSPLSTANLAAAGVLLIPILLLSGGLSDEGGDSPALGLPTLALTFGLGLLIGAAATSSTAAPPPRDLPSLLISIRSAASRLAAAVDGGVDGEAKAAAAQLDEEAATLAAELRVAEARLKAARAAMVEVQESGNQWGRARKAQAAVDATEAEVRLCRLAVAQTKSKAKRAGDEVATWRVWTRDAVAALAEAQRR